MKNLLIYINPDGFDPETEKLARIQIDNSLELGWKPEDIILVTNFPYEYNGIRAIVIGDDTFCPFYKEASKAFAIIRMFESGLIGDDIYWFHDFDAYQLEPITEEELGLEDFEAGFCDHGRRPDWNTGSFFFKNSTEDLFRAMAARVKPGLNKDRRHQHEQQALQDMTNEDANNINARIKRMNITYNFGMRRIELLYQLATKPIKVLHFHPYHPRNKGLDTLGIALRGKNRLGFPLMNKRLIKIFNRYGYS